VLGDQPVEAEDSPEDEAEDEMENGQEART
jgi:hypothetical protein